MRKTVLLCSTFRIARKLCRGDCGRRRSSSDAFPYELPVRHNMNDMSILLCRLTRRRPILSAGNAAKEGVRESIIYSNTNVGQRDLIFTIEVPEKGSLGLNLKARKVVKSLPQEGAFVKGFHPITMEGQPGYIEVYGCI
jgi:hypothetical protein